MGTCNANLCLQTFFILLVTEVCSGKRTGFTQHLNLSFTVVWTVHSVCFVFSITEQVESHHLSLNFSILVFNVTNSDLDVLCSKTQTPQAEICACGVQLALDFYLKLKLLSQK